MKYNRQTPVYYENLNVMFHGIPKNASTTVKNALYELEHGQLFDNDNKQWIHKGNEKGGSVYPPVQDILEGKYDTTFHFTVSRHPYSRFISFYTDLVQRTAAHRFETPPFYRDNNIDLTNLSINEAIDLVCSYSDDEGDEHFVSQDSFIYVDECDYIHLETLGRDWKQLCRQIFVDPIPLTRYNKSNGTIELDEEQKIKLYNRYILDFKRFRYER